MKLGIIETTVHPVQLSSNCDQYDLCTSPVYDHVRTPAQRSWTGLMESCETLERHRTAGIFTHNTGSLHCPAAFGCDPDFRAIHGTVLCADILGGNKVVLVEA